MKMDENKCLLMMSTVPGGIVARPKYYNSPSLIRRAQFEQVITFWEEHGPDRLLGTLLQRPGFVFSHRQGQTYKL